MTNRVFLNNVMMMMDGMTFDEDTISEMRITAMKWLEKTNTRNSVASAKRSAKSCEAKNAIIQMMRSVTEPVTAKELSELWNCEFSVQKIARICSGLANDGILTRSTKKSGKSKVNAYAIAEIG